MTDTRVDFEVQKGKAVSYTKVETESDEHKSLNHRLEKLVALLVTANGKLDSIERNLLPQRPTAVDDAKPNKSEKGMADQIDSSEYLASQLDQRLGEIIQEIG